jgi:hypothetical protein
MSFVPDVIRTRKASPWLTASGDIETSKLNEDSGKINRLIRRNTILFIINKK